MTCGGIPAVPSGFAGVPSLVRQLCSLPILNAIISMTYKEEFLTLLRSTGRDGLEDVITKMEELGFFIAPASTKYHLNYEGGLLEHSVKVCRAALKLREAFIDLNPSLAERLPRESVIIAALLHDVCKAEIYKPVTKKEKNTQGIWVETQGYAIDDTQLPLGHGEKSVVELVSWGLMLTRDEQLAIRWHMGAWDLAMESTSMKASFGRAQESTPLVTILISADNMSSYLLEDRD